MQSENRSIYFQTKPERENSKVLGGQSVVSCFRTKAALSWRAPNSGEVAGRAVILALGRVQASPPSVSVNFAGESKVDLR